MPRRTHQDPDRLPSGDLRAALPLRLAVSLCLSIGPLTADAAGWNCQPLDPDGWPCAVEHRIEAPEPPAASTAVASPAATRPVPAPRDPGLQVEGGTTSAVGTEIASGIAALESAPAAKLGDDNWSAEPDDAFTLQRDWVRLKSLDQGLPNAACLGLDAGSRRAPAAAPGIDIGSLVYAEADSAETQETEGRTVLSGDVFLQSGRETLEADEITYERDQDSVVAVGAVRIGRPDLRASGERADYRLDTDQGSIEQTEYRLLSANARGFAARAEFLGADHSRFQDIQYTTCPAGNDDWLLSAGSLEIDQAEGAGVARDATLRLGGVPVMYIPWMSFPTDDRRRSGLLVPTIGITSNTGLDLSLPYYLNLAPNYDATLTPRLMSKRGLLLGAEFRYLGRNHDGEVIGEILPNDEDHPDNNTRGSLRLRHNASLAPRWRSAVRLNYASDADYLDDLGSSLAVTSTRFLERAGEVRYYADSWDLLGRLQHYQTLDRTISPADRPYSRLPHLLLELEQPGQALGLSYHLRSEYVNFHRENAEHGQRIDLYPGISLPVSNTWAYTDKSAVRYTAYDLSNAPSVRPSSPDRALPVLSLDSGLFFDRPSSWFGEAVTQTLEPRLFYLYVPKTSQDDLPVFDTGEFDFSFDNLFRDNRFNGADRLGDANQLTLALTSRALAASDGRELFRASLGQIYYFSDRRVNLPDQDNQSDSTSALVTEFEARLSNRLRARGGLQWDPSDGAGDIAQALAQLKYLAATAGCSRPRPLRHGVAQQVDLAGLWPLTDELSLIGRWNHSLHEDRLLEGLLGIEYGRCCWRLRLLARRYADSDIDGHNTSVLLQLELNGLGKIGDSIDNVLERGIYGYQINAND